MKYRKIPKISPSMYNPPEYKAPGGLYLEIALKIQTKTKQKRSISFQL